MTKLQKIKTRINRGVNFLNGDMPGWVKSVKIKDLEMVSPNTCIVGQVYGNYDNWKKDRRVSRSRVTLLGFTAPAGLRHAAQDVYWISLQKEWLKVLRSMKNKISAKKK